MMMSLLWMAVGARPDPNRWRGPPRRRFSAGL
jgi:hypothetical protein